MVPQSPKLKGRMKKKGTEIKGNNKVESLSGLFNPLTILIIKKTKGANEKSSQAELYFSQPEISWIFLFLVLPSTIFNTITGPVAYLQSWKAVGTRIFHNSEAHTKPKNNFTRTTRTDRSTQYSKSICGATKSTYHTWNLDSSEEIHVEGQQLQMCSNGNAEKQRIHN